jgi:hypothetical protein
MVFTYAAEGVAYGPYPGTFTESGTVRATLGAPRPFVGGQFAFGTVFEVNATFTINSPAGQVTGTKTLSQFFPVPESVCLKGFVDVARLGDHEVVYASVHYEATIRPPTGGRFTDEGEATLDATRICYRIPGSSECSEEFGFFFEDFRLSTGVLPVDTTGKATGGGQIVSGSNLFERVTYGFNVRKDEGSDRLKGTCNVLDHATWTHVKCLTVTDYQQIGNTATWEGTAEVNGVEEDYRITVQDNGEPNQGIDTFSIVTDSYEAAGNVQHGNIQLHKQQLAL